MWVIIGLSLGSWTRRGPEAENFNYHHFMPNLSTRRRRGFYRADGSYLQSKLLGPHVWEGSRLQAPGKGLVRSGSTLLRGRRRRNGERRRESES